MCGVILNFVYIETHNAMCNIKNKKKSTNFGRNPKYEISQKSMLQDLELRKKLVKCYIWSIALGGC